MYCCHFRDMKNAASVALTYTHALTVNTMTPQPPAAKSGPISPSIKIKRTFASFFTVHTKTDKHQDKAADQKARAALAEIFGEDLPADDVDSIQTAQTEAERTLTELKRLFGESE